jgi:hypothetical protein
MTHGILRRLYWISLVLAIASLCALAIIDQHLKTPVSPLGIVSFELCAYESACASIPASWDAKAKLYAAMSLGLDHLFMLAYPAAISCGLWLFRSRCPALWRTPTMLMICAVWVAGAADAVENHHLFQMLLDQPMANHQWPATLAATVKFLCLMPALTLWLLSVIWHKLPGAGSQAPAA